MQIIDAHVHPFVTPEQRMGRHSGFVTDMDYFVEDLQRAGITHCCGSVIERLNVSSWEDVRRLNDQALEIGERYPDFYTPGFHIHPAFPVESCEEIERMSAKGVKLIGELVWYMMGWEQYADPRLREAFELAAQKGMTVNIHPSTYEDMDRFAEQNPNLDIIVAHPRDGADYEDNLRRLRKFDHVYLDLSGTGLFRYGMLRRALDTVGSEKLLFGTDYPICNPGMYVEAVLFEQTTDQELENIFEKNAERLITKKETV
ncbi:MAG: amidohydrolase [Firmicutes bacterium]|nr:amidohydrolase [Bacillota bacterium]